VTGILLGDAWADLYVNDLPWRRTGRTTAEGAEEFGAPVGADRCGPRGQIRVPRITRSDEDVYGASDGQAVAYVDGMLIPGLGQVVRDVELGWYRSEAIPVPVLGGAPCCFVIDGYETDPSPEDFHAAIRAFLAADRSALAAAAPAIFTYYRDVMDEVVAGRDDYWAVTIEGPHMVFDHKAEQLRCSTRSTWPTRPDRHSRRATRDCRHRAGLATTRSTLLRLAGTDSSPPAADATVASPAYQQILAVFATTDHSGLREGHLPRARYRYRRQGHRKGYAPNSNASSPAASSPNSSPALFALAQPAASGPDPTPES
jgi:hypothetical protein